jgi:hypothetical protein
MNFLTRKKSTGQAGDENVSVIIKRFRVYTLWRPRVRGSTPRSESESLSKIASLAVHAASLI